MYFALQSQKAVSAYLAFHDSIIPKLSQIMKK